MKRDEWEQEALLKLSVDHFLSEYFERPSYASLLDKLLGLKNGLDRGNEKAFLRSLDKGQLRC